jgi:hypothetical protein
MIGSSLLAPRGDVAGPAPDERHADAALVERPLAALERAVVGDAVGLLDAGGLVAADAAVIAGEDQDGVVRELQIVEQLHDAADRLVDAVDHGGVRRVLVPATGCFFLNFSINSGLAWCGAWTPKWGR